MKMRTNTNVESPGADTTKANATKGIWKNLPLIFHSTPDFCALPIANRKTRKFNPHTFKPAYVKSGKKRDYTDPEIDAQVRHYFKMNCDVCGVDMETFRLAKRHYRIEHKQDGYITCCGKKFFQRHRAIDHTLQHVNPENYYK